MRDQRSGTQVLFGFLPEQTVDAKGSVWKVKDWRNADRIKNIYKEGLRSELCRLASPWEAAGTDGGFVQDLMAKTDLEVVEVNRESGVQLEPFPRQWVCRTCNRLHDTPAGGCLCGSSDARGQLPFVGFHPGCGDLIGPSIQRCPTHRQVKVVWPGTSSAREITFVCPVCSRTLQRGFFGKKCTCGVGDSAFVFQVHRSSSVFTPRTCVLVNPPSNQRIQEITDAGGPSRALRWVVDGMPAGGVQAGLQTRDALTRTLKAQGLSDSLIKQMIAVAEKAGQVADDPLPIFVPMGMREEAEKEAVTIALSVEEPRTTIASLRLRSRGSPVLSDLHSRRYTKALDDAGLFDVELIDRFPVLTAQFGYTRGGGAPGEDRLRAYRRGQGGYVIYGDLAKTEALFFRLSPSRVAEWLRRRGHAVGPTKDDQDARIAILRDVAVPGFSQDPSPDVGSDLLTLTHSYCHRALRTLSVFAGMDRNALSELLVPRHLGFYIYGAARGDFVLGGLQAVFDTELDGFLASVVFDESRCPLDPGCISTGGACPACLHIGEPSCRGFNRYLDRTTLFGSNGYLNV